MPKSPPPTALDRTPLIRLIFTRRFNMAHRLISGCSTLCGTPHGHTQFVRVELVPAVAERLDGETNMVVEFSAAKTRWHAFIDEAMDHGLQLSSFDSLLRYADAHHPEWRLVVTPGNPTTEMMAALLASKCQAILDDEGVGLLVERLTLEETPTNSVMVVGDGRRCLPTSIDSAASDGWWLRSDQSTR